MSKSMNRVELGDKYSRCKLNKEIILPTTDNRVLLESCSICLFPRLVQTIYNIPEAHTHGSGLPGHYK